MSNHHRREFIVRSALAGAALSCAGMLPSLAVAADPEHKTKPRRLLKTLKIGMVKIPGSLTDKFKGVKAAGYDGIELDAPTIKVDEVKKAIQESGLPVDGSVCSTHWKITHTHADPKVRAQALSDCKTHYDKRMQWAVIPYCWLWVSAVMDRKAKFGPRAVENIKQAIPLAAELGVTIAIENVWNKFLYEHDGPNNQSADKFVKFVDEFKSPFVGMQFDIGNHWKYGNPAEWIRALGTRIVKLDIKGYSRKANNWAEMLEDDLPWADVRQALDDINFHGWVAAEVGGGDQERLTKVAKQIDRALNIG